MKSPFVEWTAAPSLISCVDPSGGAWFHKARPACDPHLKPVEQTAHKSCVPVLVPSSHSCRLPPALPLSSDGNDAVALPCRGHAEDPGLGCWKGPPRFFVSAQGLPALGWVLEPSLRQPYADGMIPAPLSFLLSCEVQFTGMGALWLTLGALCPTHVSPPKSYFNEH